MTENPIRNIKTHTLTLANPFPGLRPFSVEESHLFFGREGQCEIVLEYLAKNRFAAVTGASGSGKSSLIYCGLIPALYGGFITNAGSKWRIITTRPGNSPVENLAEAFASIDNHEKSDEETNLDKQILYTILRRSSFGLVNAVRQIKLARGENILLILDQFEELFRYKESRKDITAVNETEAYIKMLINAIKQKDQPIYVVLTMRSDFIGECSQFQELTKLINKSNFLIPQMTRDDFKEAITGPLAVGGAAIDPQLLQHLLNAIEDKNDQLPVLQHVMMRTWEFWTRNNEPNIPLRTRDYEVAGKIENALSMHANEAFEELTDEGKVICKAMFRCLTEKGTDNKGTRHPATIKYIGEIAQVPDEKVIDVVNKFRAKGRSFLTPGEEVLIDSDSVIDISHESLMRIWDKLKSWVDEEFSSVQMYLRLAEASSQYQVGKTGLWRPPDLQLALNWKKTQRPTLAWAKKYNPAFEKVMVFLDASEKKYQQEEQNKVRLQRMELNRTRKFAVSSLFAAVAFLFISVWGFQQRGDAIKKAREAVSSRDEAEFRKKEADSLRIVADGKASMAQVEQMLAEVIADSAERASTLAFYQSKLSEQQKIIAFQRAEEAAKKSVTFQKQKEEAEKTADKAIEKQIVTEKEKSQELKNKMLSIAQTMAVKSSLAEDNNLKGLLAYQAFLFNRDYEGQPDHPDIYIALYDALSGFNGNDFNSLPAHERSVRSLAFVPGSAVFYSSGNDGQILRWDMNGNTKSYRTLIRNTGFNRSMVISHSGRWLACGTTTSGIQLFNLNTANSVPEILQGHKSWVVALAFTSDSKGLFSASTDKSIIYWDLIAGTNSVFLTFPNTNVKCLAVSPTGRYVFGGTDDGRLLRWNMDTKEQTVLFQSDKNTILAIAINSTGSRIAFVDMNGSLRLLDARSNSVVRTIPAHSVRIMDVKFSPDDRQIATSSMDKTVKIWDVTNFNNLPIIIDKHKTWVLAVAFSPDGKYLVSSSDDGDIYYWPTHASYLAEQMCGKVTRNLTQREWETYVSYDILYQKTCPNK
jgi:Tol biopolymer transport system component/energy-coupling factor transporter ATP-binding protein EcfA2